MKFIVIILCFCFVGTAQSQSWKKYPYQAAGSDIVFPNDEGRHVLFPKFNLEWWYLVVHAKGKVTGDDYSILVSHFNNRIRFFTITNVDKKVHESATAIGSLKNAKDHLNLTHKINGKTDYFRSKKNENGKVIPFEYEVKTHAKNMEIDIAIDAVKPPLLINGTGYGPVGSSGFTWYYSLSRVNINGDLKFKGINEPIEGIGWIDHQWGPFVVSPVRVGKMFETYEWFCLQLDNGMDIMVSIIFDRNNRLNKDERYGGINISTPDGKTISNSKYSFKRTKFWKDENSKKTFSMGWELSIPEQRINLKLTPTFKEQMVKMALNGDFWEGSVAIDGTVGEDVVKGKGFGELMHDYQPAKLDLWSNKKDYTLTDTIKLNWKVLNPDDGNPQRFDVMLISGDHTVKLASDLTESKLDFKLDDYINQNQMKSRMEIQVHATSIDKFIRSNKSLVLKIK